MLALNIHNLSEGKIYHPNPILNPLAWDKEDFSFYDGKVDKLLKRKFKHLYNNGEPKIKSYDIEVLNEKYVLEQIDIEGIEMPDDIQDILDWFNDNVKELIAEAVKNKLYGDLEYTIAVEVLLGTSKLEEVGEVGKSNLEYLFSLSPKTYYKTALDIIRKGEITNIDLDNIVIKKTSKYYYNHKLPTPYIPLLAREHVFTPDGEPWNPKLMQMYYLYHEVDKTVNLLLSKRQFGKSLLTTLIAFQHLMMDGENSILYLVESENKILPIMQYFERGLKKYKRAGIFSMSKNDYTIKCNITGNVLKFMSAGSRTGVKGYSFKKVIIDEADYISDDVFFSLIPIFNKPGGKLYAVSTVAFDTKGKSTWFYDLSKDIELGLGKMIGNIPSQALTVTLYEDEAVTQEQMQMFEIIRKRDPMRFLGDYMCIRGDQDTLFDKKKIVSPLKSDEFKQKNIIQVIIGFDPAKKYDYGGLTISYVISDDLEQYIVPVISEELERMDYIDQIQKIRNYVDIHIIKQLPITLIIDETGVGAAVSEMIRQYIPDVYMIKLMYTAGNSVSEKKDSIYVPKKELVDTLSTLADNLEVKIPYDLKGLIEQLDTYRNVNGKYEAITGHDDLIESFLNTTFIYNYKMKKRLKLFGNSVNSNTEDIITIPAPSYTKQRMRRFIY